MTLALPTRTHLLALVLGLLLVGVAAGGLLRDGGAAAPPDRSAALAPPGASIETAVFALG